MSKIRIAFLGTGGISLKHSRFLKDCPDAEIVGGCDVSEEIVKGLWERTWDGTENAPDPPAFTDIDRMFDQTNPDAVVICTPHTLHYDHCMKAATRGCHILVEKPMVTRAKVSLIGDQLKEARVGEYTIKSDEHRARGGDGEGPAPLQYFIAAIGF